MLITEALGFSNLVLVLSFVFPVIGFISRRKWKRSVDRNEEIKRLLIFASQETARAELEANQVVSSSPSYYGVVWEDNSSNSNNNSTSYSYQPQCAVCYCPTTTRCSRCKAVRYCSGKCQIIHWRQGHKEECRPVSVTHNTNDNGGNSSQKVVKKEQNDTEHERNETSTIEKSSKKPVLFNSSGSHVVPPIKDDDIRFHLLNDKTSASDSRSSSFSGFSTSLTGSESSDDLSVGESNSSNEWEGTDGLVSSASVPAVPDSVVNKEDEANPVSPKFANLVDNVDSFESPSKLKQNKVLQNDGENQGISSTAALGQMSSTLHGVSSNQPDKVSSGFWDRSLDTAISRYAFKCGPDLSSTNGAVKNKLSDSESFLRFKFDLCGSNVAPSNARNSEKKGIVSDDASSTATDVGRPINGAAMSENPSGGDVPIIRRSTSSDSHTSLTNRDIPHKGPSNISGSGVSNSQLSGSTKSNVAAKDTIITSHLSKSKVSSSAPHMCLASSENGPSTASSKSGIADNLEVDAVTSSQNGAAASSISGLKSSVMKVADQLRGPKCGKYCDKGLFSYDLFVKLYTSNKVEMQPCGLINCGNSCYANAVLQCLAFTPPLTTYFGQGLHSKECVNKECCFTCEFESLMLRAKEGKSPLSPIGILSQLQNIGSQLGSGREEDAHEFLRYAIDKMQSVCLKEAGVSSSGAFEEDTTLFGLTFGGYLRSKIKCIKCRYKSERQERMMDLTVEIEGDIGRLEDALKRFTSTEILDGDNKYLCGRCKTYEKAKKKLTILEAPNVLTIALKRFQSGKFGKLNKPIRFPEILDLAPYMSGTSDKSPIYRLYGVIVHLDVMNASFSGHYVCYVKNIQNKWFKIDDSTVTPVDLERVLAKGAYTLLYARCSPRAPRSIRNQISSCDLKMRSAPSKISVKNTAFNSRSSSSLPGVVQLCPNSIPPDSMDSAESFFSKFHRHHRILEEDSSSDNYSFTSSNSDEGSCSTESTRDSTSTEDLSELIFGGFNHWNVSDSDASSSSSSSPMNTSHSTETSSYRHSSVWDPKQSRSVGEEKGGGAGFSRSDSSKQCRKLGSSSSCSCREANSEKLGVNPVRCGESIRR